MSDYVSASVYSLFHLLGHGVPTVLTNVFYNGPISAYKTITGGPPREGAWLLASSAGRTRQRDDEARSEAKDFNSMAFFGFQSHDDPHYRAHGFTNEKYPYPLYSGHYHTIVGGGRKPSRKMGYEREEIKAKFDGNTLFLEWRMCDANKYPEGPKGVIAVVPGLCSGPNTSYVQRFVRHANKHGFHVVVLAIRGMGSSPLEYGNMTAGTFTHDIAYVLEDHLTSEYITTRFGKNLKLVAVGFSLGGAMLANHLGKTPNSRLHCAIAAESPWDFHQSTAMMGTRFARLAYQPALMKGLWNVIKKTGDNIIEHTKSDTLRENLQMLQGKMTKKDGMKGYTVNDFDNLVVAPAQGYESANAYYTVASPFQRLGQVTVPLMCFSAMDDPITGPPPALDQWDAVCDANPNILHVRCPTGGHLGFMRGPIDELQGRPGFMDELVVRAFESAAANASNSTAAAPTRSNSKLSPKM